MQPSFITLAVLFVGVRSQGAYDETVAKQYLEYVNLQEAAFIKEVSIADWNYDSNITDENLEISLSIGAKYAEHVKQQWEETILFPWQTFEDPDIVRQFSKLVVLGKAALSPEKFDELDRTVSQMSGIYGAATVCDYNNSSNCKFFLEPEITERFVNSRDSEELKYYWKAWRDASGKQVRSLYPTYVNLSNEAAIINNFTDNAAYWISSYENDDFPEIVENLWQQLRPLYLQLHAYVRRRLYEFYGEDVVSKTGPIPAHLLDDLVLSAMTRTVLHKAIDAPSEFGNLRVSKKLPDKMEVFALNFWGKMN